MMNLIQLQNQRGKINIHFYLLKLMKIKKIKYYIKFDKVIFDDDEDFEETIEI